MTRSPLVVSPRPRLDVEAFAHRAGLHPDLVIRFVTLGLLDPVRDSAGQLWFGKDQLDTVARLQRLRSGLSLNYAALGLVAQLLDRIEELERELRRRAPFEWAPSGRAPNGGGRP